jgi:16S rRNA G1207 methylase RsmC
VFSDVNEKALKNTQENLTSNGMEENSTIVHSDLFDHIPQKFDCIFANLPISNEAFKLEERTENIALRFLKECKNHIHPDGKVFFAR